MFLTNILLLESWGGMNIGLLVVLAIVVVVIFVIIGRSYKDSEGLNLNKFVRTSEDNKIIDEVTTNLGNDSTQVKVQESPKLKNNLDKKDSTSTKISKQSSDIKKTAKKEGTVVEQVSQEIIASVEPVSLPSTDIPETDQPLLSKPIISIESKAEEVKQLNKIESVKLSEVEQSVSTPVSVVTSTASDSIKKGSEEIHKVAQRVARTIVSDIKIYNEKKVVDGRAAKNMYDILQKEFDSGFKIYDERIDEVVRNEASYLYQTIVEKLCEGDPSCLGPNFPSDRIKC